MLSLFLVALAIVGCHSKDLEKTTRIAGGREVNIDAAPFTVQLKYNNGFFCAGTLIGARYVLTAAHCFDGMNYQKVTVVGGASKLDDKGVQKEIVDVYISAEYNNVTNDSDGAMLILDSDMKGPNIKAISLYNQELKTGDFIDVYGWGVTKFNGTLSNQLRHIRIPIIDHKKCMSMHYKGEVTDNMMCAAGKGKDACSADSGGPAVYRGQLAGIVSWGINCGHSFNPGVYTKLYAIRWFIDGVLEIMMSQKK